MNSVWCGSPFVASFSSMFGVRCWMFDVPQGQNSGSRLIAPVLGLWPSVLLIAALNVTLLPIAIWRKHEPLRRRILWIPIPLVAFFVIGSSAWLARSLPPATVAPTERLAALAVGREGVVATLQCGPGDWRMLFNNSYTLGGSKAQF